MLETKELNIGVSDLKTAILMGIPFLAVFLALTIKTSPIISFGAFLGLAALAVIFLEPFISLVLCYFVLFSGIIWGLGITKGFLPLAILSILAWVAKKIWSLDLEFVWDRQIGYVIAFFVFVLLSVVAAYDQLYAFKYTFVYVKLIVFYIFVSNVIKTKKHIWTLIYMMIFANVISILYGFYKILWALNSPGGMIVEMRMRGLTDSPNTLALHAVLIFPIFVFLLFREGWNLKSLAYLGIIILLTSGIVATFSRGGTVAFAAVIFVLFYLKRSWSLFAILFLLAIFLALFVIPPEFYQHLDTLVNVSKFLQDSSLRERSKLFMAGIKVFSEHPLFGIGIGNFLIVSRNFVLEHLAVHNIILQVASETGIFGCLFFLLAFFRTFVNFKYARIKFYESGERTLALVIQGLSIGFLGIFIGALFLSMQEYFVLWTLFGLSVAMRHAADKEHAIIKNQVELV